MRDASHTNPYTDESFGDSVAYTRGRVVAADGGRADAADEDEAAKAEADGEEEAEVEKTIADVDHTPQRDAPDTSGVYQRGAEGE